MKTLIMKLWRIFMTKSFTYFLSYFCFSYETCTVFIDYDNWIDEVSKRAKNNWYRQIFFKRKFHICFTLFWSNFCSSLKFMLMFLKALLTILLTKENFSFLRTFCKEIKKDNIGLSFSSKYRKHSFLKTLFKAAILRMEVTILSGLSYVL